MGPALPQPVEKYEKYEEKVIKKIARNFKNG